MIRFGLICFLTFLLVVTWSDRIGVERVWAHDMEYLKHRFVTLADQNNQLQHACKVKIYDI